MFIEVKIKIWQKATSSSDSRENEHGAHRPITCGGEGGVQMSHFPWWGGGEGRGVTRRAISVMNSAFVDSAR